MKHYLSKLHVPVFLMCIIAATALIITGCTEKDLSFINVNNGALELTSAAHKEVIEIKTNTKWNVNSDAAWCRIIRGTGSLAGSFDVIIDENVDVQSRSAIVTVAGDDCSATVLVRQAGAGVNLAVSQENIEFYKNAETQIISVFSNNDWSVTSSNDWCTVSKTTGTGNDNFTISVLANNTGNTRSALITVSSVSNGKTSVCNINVSQATVVATISVSPNEKVVGSAPENFTLTVLSSVKWNASVDSGWLSIDKTTGDGDATIKVSTSVNNTKSERKGIITIYTEGESGNRQTRIITVTQGVGSATLSISPGEKALASTAEEFIVTVLSSGKWNASVDSNWLSIDKTTGDGDATIKVSASENSANSERKGVITIYAEGDGGLRETRIVPITQGAKGSAALSVSPSEKTVASTAEEFNVTVLSSGKWDASIDSDWFVIDKSTGNGDATIKVSVNANNTNNERNGVITVYAEGGGGLRETRIVSITQGAKGSAILNVSPSEKTVASTAEEFNVTVLSSGKWNASVDSDWFVIDKSTGNGDATIKVSVNANNTNSNREGTIIIHTESEGGKREVRTVTITQGISKHYLEIPITEYLIPKDSALFEVKYLLSGYNCTIETTSNATWVTPTVYDGFIEIVVTENTGKEERTAILSVNTVGQSDAPTIRTVTIKQAATNNILELSVSEITLNSMGETANVKLSTNTSFDTHTTAPWITITKLSGAIEITANMNTTGETRVGYITVSVGGTSGEQKSKTVKVTQSHADVDFKFEPSMHTFDYNQGSQSIVLKSTIGNWAIETPIQNIPKWISVSSTSGIGSTPINITVTRNTYVRNRNFDLIFKNALTGLTAILSIQQSKDPAIVLADYKYLGMGYDAAGEYAVDRYVRAQIFDWGKLEEKGYLAGVTSHNMTEESYIYGNSIAQYQNNMSASANVSGGIKGFSASVKTNFSATSYSSSENEFATFRSVTQKQSVQLHTNITVANLMECLTDEFKADIATMTTDNLFQKYGTHVIGGFIMGGTLDYSMTADKSSMSTSIDFGAAVQAGFNFASSGISTGVEYNQYNATKLQASNFEERLLVRGGQSQQASSFGSQAAHDQWLASLSEPSTWVLTDYSGPKLFNIWDFAGSRKAEIQTAAGVWLAKETFVPVSTHKTLRFTATSLSYLQDDAGSEAEVLLQAFITVPPGAETTFINLLETNVPDQGGIYTFPSSYSTPSYSLSYRKAHAVTLRITGTETDVTNSDDFSGSFTLTYNPTTDAWSLPSGVTISNNSFILTAKDNSNNNALSLYCTISWQ